VAVSASDAEYFAEICRDLAQSLQSEAGRTACEAQDEVSNKVVCVCLGLCLSVNFGGVSSDAAVELHFCHTARWQRGFERFHSPRKSFGKRHCNSQSM
jgi:hypothetical protein